MNGKINDLKEQSLVRLYMDLMGTSEADARSVFMHVCTPDPKPSLPAGPVVLKPQPDEVQGEEASPARPSRAALLLFVLTWLSLGAPQLRAAQPIISTNNFFTQPLSLADAINLALRQNPNVLRAQKDLEAAQGVVIETRAIVIPKVNANGYFNAFQRSDVDIVNFPNTNSTFTAFGNTENWSTQIRLVQSLYEGGRMLSALRAARLTKERSLLNYQTAVADALLDVEIAYDDVLLDEQQIIVQEASVELLQNELTDTTRRFDAGTVPRFNVLRAEVELANAQPKLIRARSNFRIAKNNLSNLLGFHVPRGTLEDIPLKLSGKLEAEPYPLDLEHALALARQQRSELGALRRTEALRAEDLVTARAGYKPSLQAFAGYDAHNSSLSQDLAQDDHGWIAGVQLSWNIFDGLATQGRVKQARALYEKAGVDLDDTARRIELEVRTAFSNFIEADEVLKSQIKVVEEAEEALRLARARSEAGTGTQLDVLSAQTALTEARTTQVEALHDYSTARARLQRAVGENLPSPN